MFDGRTNWTAAMAANLQRRGDLGAREIIVSSWSIRLDALAGTRTDPVWMT